MRTPELEALAALVRVAEQRGLRVLLIGAMARQLVFDQHHRGAPYRATRDIDTVVRVSNWEEFNALVADLIETAGFTKSGEHLFRYQDGTELDLLPFGGVADTRGTLTWTGGDRVMSLEGLEAADAHGEQVEVAGAIVRIANLPSLVALKLFAFRDRAERTSKDLSDLIYILANASDVLIDRVYSELGAELADFDFDETGPFLLGQDVARTVPPNEQATLISILNEHILKPPDYSKLSGVIRGAHLERTILQFEAFRSGLAGGWT